MKTSVGAILVTWISVACVGTTRTTDRLPQASTLREGEGLAFGSILVITPEPASPEQARMIDALRQRELTATFRRFVRRGGEPGGEFTWRDYEGDEFVVEFRSDAEQPFVLSGPAGLYEILELTDHHPSAFQDQHRCRIEGLGQLEVVPGKATYVGRLVLRVGFKPEQERWLTRLAESFTSEPGFPERDLDMTPTVEDVLASALDEVDPDRTFAATEIETRLLSPVNGRWDFELSQTPEPPGPPGPR